MISNGSMSSSRSGTLDTSMSRPDLAAGGHLRRGRRQPGGAQVLERGQRAAVQQLQARLHDALLLERVADLHRRALGVVLGVQLGRGQHRRAADAVAARARAHEHQQVAHARGGRAGQPVVVGDAQAHGVDQAVGLVRALEVDLAADGGHADGVAVVADARDRAVQQVQRARRLQLAEAQRVQDGDRPRADREHVAQDAADARGRALERLDRGRVVVRLDLERDGHAVAHVHGAGVLARAHQQVRPLDRQPAQQLLRVLVGAVLGPHQAEHGQLEPVGVAPHLLADELVLGVGQAELAVRRGGAHAATVAAWRASDSNSSPPSAEPVSSSTACSGWGIRPMTLPASLVTPAMSRSEPLGLCPSA